MFDARQRIWIATPYFVPDSALIRGLVLAARRGVDVRVVVPARSNHITADYAGASYLRQLAAEGGQICCYQPGMLHAKCVLVDQALAVIGSANLDMRSLFLNYEIALFQSSPTELAACEAWFTSVWPACAPLPPARKPRQPDAIGGRLPVIAELLRDCEERARMLACNALVFVGLDQLVMSVLARRL